MPIHRSSRCRNSTGPHRAGPPDVDGRVFCIRCGDPLGEPAAGRSTSCPSLCLFFLLVLACAIAASVLFSIFYRV